MTIRIKAGLFVLMSIISFSGFAKDNVPYVMVDARQNAKSTEWNSYRAQTVDRIPGFKTVKEPRLDQYGGWLANQQKATGFFRTALLNNRWWIIDPEGYPYIFKGIAVFRAGSSEYQTQRVKDIFGTDSIWAEKESKKFKMWGFNGTGAWSNVDLVRTLKTPLPYTVIINPMHSYRTEHVQKFGGKYKETGWQGYRFDLVMVFDPEFDRYIEKSMKEIVKYKNDKFLIGYFTDNELPWKNDALDRHLNLLAKDENAYLVVKKWLDDRKGKNATVTDITQEDRNAFTAFYFETYMKKVTEALRKADPNHMYLGCRFNQEKEELSNPEMFKVAGKYMDIISINHYRKWQPIAEQMKNWGEWSGKPFLITEWYTKGEDSGMPNNSGAGWNVHTQLDRGYFYENFAIELLRCNYNIGWNWFTYQDNDPKNLDTDESNRDSNKGLVDSDFKEYTPMLERARLLNGNVWNLIHFFDRK